MKKTKILTRGITTALAVVSVFFVSHYAKAGENYIKTGEKVDFTELYDSKEFSTDNSKVTLSKDNKTDGLFVDGKTEEIENARFMLSKEIDFSDKSGYLVFSGTSERKRDVTISLYLDDSTKSFAKVKLTRQNRKNAWSTDDNRCIKISDEIKGKHKIYFKFTDNNGNKYKGKSLKILLKYTFVLDEDIPMVDLDIDESKTPIAAMNGDPNHQTECYGNMTVDIPKGYKSEYTDKKLSTKTYELDYIRGRGNSTWGPDKKPYKLKLDKKADLLGMGSDKHWILLVSYYDISMLRNKFTYWLGNVLGLEYTPKCEFVNVVMNGKYLGSYYLSEQVRVGKNRVNIDDLSADDESKAVTSGSAITGGYLLSCEKADDRMNITTDKGMSFAIESPDFEDYTNLEQYNYISDYLKQTEAAIYGKGFKDSKGVSYEDYMDVDSAIDYYWVQEFSLNGDAFISGSTYLYKKRDGKLYWGPLWDFDYVAWGATEYTSNSVEGLNLDRNAWFTKLFANEKFRKKFVARWPYIKEKLLEGIKDGGIIDTYSQKQYASQKANYYVNKMYSQDDILEYNDVLKDIVNDMKIDENIGKTTENMAKITYDSEEQRLKQWIRERIDWIDKNISSINDYCASRQFVFMVNGKTYATVDYIFDTGVELPKEPTKKGYSFCGWYYKQKAGKKTYEIKFDKNDLTTLTDEKVTLYAKWKKKTKANTVKKFIFQYNDIYLSPYDDYSMKYGIQPFGAVISGIKWKSSDEKIVTVDESGTIHVVTEKPGVCTVTAKVKGLKAVRCKIHIVSWDKITGLNDFNVAKNKITLKKGKYARIKVSLLPKNAYNPNITYVSSNKKVVQVDEIGMIHAKKKGKVTIVVYCASLEKAELVTVKVK